MSVVEGERNVGDLAPYIDAMELAKYTVKILANPKNFDPDIDKDLIKETKKCACNIYINIWSAYDLGIKLKSKEWKNKQKQLLIDAVLECSKMNSYIMLNKMVFHVSYKRESYWINLLNKTYSSLIKLI